MCIHSYDNTFTSLGKYIHEAAKPKLYTFAAPSKTNWGEPE